MLAAVIIYSTSASGLFAERCFEGVTFRVKCASLPSSDYMEEGCRGNPNLTVWINTNHCFSSLPPA
jgi:hypothetical protein